MSKLLNWFEREYRKLQRGSMNEIDIGRIREGLKGVLNTWELAIKNERALCEKFSENPHPDIFEKLLPYRKKEDPTNLKFNERMKKLMGQS